MLGLPHCTCVVHVQHLCQILSIATYVYAQVGIVGEYIDRCRSSCHPFTVVSYSHTNYKNCSLNSWLLLSVVDCSSWLLLLLQSDETAHAPPCCSCHVLVLFQHLFLSNLFCPECSFYTLMTIQTKYSQTTITKMSPSDYLLPIFLVSFRPHHSARMGVTGHQ